MVETAPNLKCSFAAFISSHVDENLVLPHQVVTCSYFCILLFEHAVVPIAPYSQSHVLYV